MDNHYHLIASTPDLNLSNGMAYFQREVSRQLNREGNRINRTFAGRYFKSHLSSNHYFINCYKYVYQNPVRAGLISRCKLYPFSTLHGLLGFSHLQIPMAEDTLLFNYNLEQHLEWLNKSPSESDLDAFKKGLKKGSFKLRKNSSLKNRHRLETKKL